MSEGIDCRLGYLSGRLKGYENEEDLVKIIVERGENEQATSNHLC